MTLRELLHEPWCLECGPVESSHPGVLPCGHERGWAPLATRMPECVPAGLEWHNMQYSQEGEWMLWKRQPDNSGGGFPITDEQATLMCTGRWVQVLADAEHKTIASITIEKDDGTWTIGRWDDSNISTGDTLLAALAAALHGLADERDKVTK